ncbi:MAG: bifunctional pyr operon transcriptional regulator/uracil phosphoribosyltransferase PyrR [Oscillospiraceae bacterium]
MSHRNIMDESDMNRACVRLAHEVIERNKGVENVVLIGIQRRGVPLAQHIADLIEQHGGSRPPVGQLDITFYRDDLSLLADHPVLSGTDIPFSLRDKCVIIVDDVIYTGRTVRAAIDAIMDVERPQCIQLMVMIDRGHRELPFRADFVGKNVPTANSEIVHVCVERFDGTNMVYIEDLPERK